MAELCSVGLDVGTTTTQLIVSRLTIQNRASAFSVPQLDITDRQILYRSPVHFTPLLQGELVDAQRLRQIVAREYETAGITRKDVDTGAVIITGETSRKENAQAVAHALADLAGDFVVATAGPDLESVLAAKGAGAVALSESSGKRLLHMDIGGGTSNLALIEGGKVVSTGCLNVGGRLLKFDKSGRITYISPVLHDVFPGKVGEIPQPGQLETLADTLVSALEMAAGLRLPNALLQRLQTQGASPLTVQGPVALSFSGGVADCIEATPADNAYGDMGPVLGRAIRRSRLCSGEYHLGAETIRATVIGAGSHSTQLSGSTVFHREIAFPMKNLPVVHSVGDLALLDGPGVLALPGQQNSSYAAVTDLAQQLADVWPPQPVLIAMEADLAKALGHALALRLPANRPILCIDRVQLTENCYLDIGTPIATALPLVVKTLIWDR